MGKVMLKRAGNHINRNGRGSICEFAAALPVLTLLIFFPMISLMSIYSVYSAADSLNKLQCEEAALLDFKQCMADRGPIKKEIPDFWLRSGVASYARPVSAIETEVSYRFASYDEYGFVNQWVVVDTSFVLAPFLNAAYIPVKIPALNEACSFRMHSERLVEDPTNAPPLLSGKN